MNPPYTGLRVLLIAAIDEVAHAHNALRRRALVRLGCEVTTLDLAHPGWLERLVRRDPVARLAAAFDEAQPKLVVVSGHETLPTAAVETVRRRNPAKWIRIHGTRISGNKAFEAAAVEAMAYDRVFVASTGATRELDRRGVKHVAYLPVGCDPSVHKPLRARGLFRANVVFVGTPTEEREDLLSGLVEFGLAVWGPGWRKTELRDYCRGELDTLEGYVRAYAGASVGVNIHRGFGLDRAHDGGGVNQRLFELAAIGVTQVVDQRGDLPSHFEDGSEVLAYSTEEELRGQVKRALQDEKHRERVAGAARQRALREHTYMHRMATVLQDVTGKKAGGRASVPREVT